MAKRARKKKIGKRFIHNQEDKLYVVIPYCKASLSQAPMRVLSERIVKAGYSCLSYEFPTNILSQDIYKTREAFLKIKKDIRKEIKRIKKFYTFKEITIIGISLGCVNATMIADNNKDIDNICLVVPGDSLAFCLWNGVATVDIKEKIEKQNISLKTLERVWKKLAPKNNLSYQKNKHIEIYISRTDDVIPYESGKRLVEEMKKKGLNPEIFTNNKLGHYLTPVKFILSKNFNQKKIKKAEII